MSTPRPRVPVPKEIIRAVVNELGLTCDHEALKSCALTGSSFLHPARQHLFSTFDISQLHKLYPLGPGGRELLKRFYKLLASSEHLVPYIRNVYLVPDDWGKIWLPHEKTVPLLIRLFTSVRSFILGGSFSDSLNFQALPANLREALQWMFAKPGLVSVEFINTVNVPVQLFWNCVDLKHLGLRNVTGFDFGDTADTDALAARTKSKPLESLKVSAFSTSTAQTLITALSHPRSVLDISTLQSITIDPKERGEDQDAAWIVIQHAAKSLSSLTWTHDIRCFGSGGDIVSPAPISLAPLPKLQHLTYTVIFPDVNSTHDSVYKSANFVHEFSPFLTFLSTSDLSSPNNTVQTPNILTSIVLTIDNTACLPDIIDNDSCLFCGIYPMWTELDSRLASHALLPSLREVRVKVVLRGYPKFRSPGWTLENELDSSYESEDEDETDEDEEEEEDECYPLKETKKEIRVRRETYRRQVADALKVLEQRLSLTRMRLRSGLMLEVERYELIEPED